MPISEVLDQWAVDQRRRGLMDSTIHLKACRLRALARVHHPLTVTEDELQAFLDARRIGAHTRSGWLANLADFYRWAIRRGHTDRSPVAEIDRPRLRRHLPRPIPTDQLTAAIADADPMRRAWLVLMAYAGLRCAEVSRLAKADLGDVEGELVLRVRGKGDRERLVPAHPFVVAVMRDPQWSTAGPMFRARHGGGVSARWVSEATRAYLHGCGFPVTAHQLRHWFGTRAYAASKDLLVVQELMGHASPSTTAVYTRWSRSGARAAVDGLPDVLAA